MIVIPHDPKIENPELGVFIWKSTETEFTQIFDDRTNELLAELEDGEEIEIDGNILKVHDNFNDGILSFEVVRTDSFVTFNSISDFPEVIYYLKVKPQNESVVAAGDQMTAEQFIYGDNTKKIPTNLYSNPIVQWATSTIRGIFTIIGTFDPQNNTIIGRLREAAIGVDDYFAGRLTPQSYDFYLVVITPWNNFINAIKNNIIHGPDARLEPPDFLTAQRPLSRRDFLQQAAAGVAFAPQANNLFQNLNPIAILRGVVNGIFNQETTPQTPTSQQGNTRRLQRLKQAAVWLLTNPYHNLFLSDPNDSKNNSSQYYQNLYSAGNLTPTAQITEFGFIKKPIFISATDFVARKLPVNEKLKQLIPTLQVSMTDMVGHMNARYKQIYNNPIEEIAKNIDPTVSEFDQLINKWAKITGIPEDVIYAIAKRESGIRSQATYIHGDNFDADNLIYRKPEERIGNPDGVMSPYSGWRIEINTGGYVAEKVNTEVVQVKPTSQQKKHNVVAFPVDMRYYKDRTTEEVIVTNIDPKIGTYDSELNIIWGLTFYLQGLQTLAEDQNYFNFITEIYNNRQDKKTVVTPTIFDYGYLIYHRGGIPIGDRLHNQQNSIQNDYTKFEYPLLLDRFIETRINQTWLMPMFQGPSRLTEDQNDGNRYYYLDWEFQESDRFKRFSQAEPRLAQQIVRLNQYMHLMNYSEDEQKKLTSS